MRSRDIEINNHHGDTETRRCFWDRVDEILSQGFTLGYHISGFQPDHFRKKRLFHSRSSRVFPESRVMIPKVAQASSLWPSGARHRQDACATFYRDIIFENHYITRIMTDHKSDSLQDKKHSSQESPCLRVSVVNKNLGEVSRVSR